MPDNLPLVRCLHSYLPMTTIRQVSRIVSALLCVTGRVTTLGISRWSGAGGGIRQKNSKPVAHIIIGFIGSGKTTFARELEKETGAIRFTKDEWMVSLFGNTPPEDKFAEYDNKMASLATDVALKCLRAGVDVIIDEGFWVKEHRDEIREKVRKVGAIPKLYYLEVPFEVMKTRTLKRSESPPIDSFNIDEESFDQYWQYFRPPGKDEEFTLIN
jgi:predicted kinase